jgi:Uma2 family endonuclease
MQEYVENGARLGWLIDPIERMVYVYQPGEAVERLDNPTEVSGEPVSAGFVLQLKDIW